MSTVDKDIRYIWHPFTQMKNAAPPISIVKAYGATLQAENGDKYLDMISSWWVNVHGHAHPHISAALHQQFNELDHTIFAGFTHPKAVEMVERILQKLGEPFAKAFFSDDGSTSVEVGLKLAIQYWKNIGKEKKKIVAFNGAYHGDTFGAMAVGDRSEFTAPFHDRMFKVEFIDPPTPGNEKESLVQFMRVMEKRDVAAFIFEPLVMGSGGMLMYDSSILNKFIGICHYHESLAIADEVMVGFGRTGKMFAQDHLDNKADIVCMSKGITGGILPLALTVTTQKVFDAFLSDDHSKTFFHGHSFTGNALACAAACASLDIFDKQETWDNIERITQQHDAFADELCRMEKVGNVRQCGTILAFDLKTSGEKTSYFNSKRDQIYNYFLQRGMLLRPLGNTIYILPPYCTTREELNSVYQAIREFLAG